MHTHTYVHEHTCASITPSTRWSTDTETHNLCTNMHTHTHVYKRIDVPIHTHMHIYTYIMSAHIYTNAYIHTPYKMYIWTHAKDVWNDGAAATAEAQLDDKKLCPSPCPLQSGGRYPSWPAPQSPVHEKRRISAEQLQPTAAHRTIMTARRPDHIHLSALVRSQSTQFTQALSLAARPWPPETRSFLCHFSGVIDYQWQTIKRRRNATQYALVFKPILRCLQVHGQNSFAWVLS